MQHSITSDPTTDRQAMTLALLDECMPLLEQGKPESSLFAHIRLSLLERGYTAAAQPSDCRSARPTGQALDTFLGSLQSEIEAIARSLYFGVRTVLSVEQADLYQEGLTGAWLATQRCDESKIQGERSLRGYCIKHARGAMLMYLRKLGYQRAISLDEYLEVETDDGSCCRELPDRPVEYRQTSYGERRRILAALRHLSETERRSVMAYYRIEQTNGRCESAETVCTSLGLTWPAYRQARIRGTKKLAKFLQPTVTREGVCG